MCYALIRIAYRGDKTREVLEVQRQADLAGKLDEIKSRSQAISISVYRCEQRITLTEQWVAAPYVEPTEEVRA